MYSLFTNYKSSANNVVRLPEWNQYRDGLRRNLATVINFYRQTSYTVASDHLLVRLLQSILVPHSLSTERYYANLLPLALTLTSPFELTSPINSGKIFNGVFYGKGNKEIIIAIDEYFDPETADKEWQSLTPVRVLRHGFTDLMMNIPTGEVRSQEQGIAVITINLPMLAIQYRAFCRAERARVDLKLTDVQRNVMQFVRMFVLPNMLFSHVDYALFNRFSRLSNNLAVSTGRSYHPFQIVDYSKRINALHLRMIETVKRSNYNFQAILANIPGVVQNDMERALLVPDVVPTRQVLWSVVLARLPVLLFLISTAKYGAKMRNQLEVDQIAETLLQLRRQRVFESSLPAELYKETMSLIDSIVVLTNNPKQI